MGRTKCDATDAELASLKMQIASSPEGVRKGLEQVTSFLATNHIDPGDIATAELVMAEALNNVVEHAHSGHTDGAIALTCAICGAEICVEILDDGHPMPGGSVPKSKAPTIDSSDFAELPEGGVGWFLIQELTTELLHERLGDKNRTSFVVGATEQNAA